MKNPAPPGDLPVDDDDTHVLPGGTKLFRITFVASPYATDFGKLRTWGPSPHGRWDPHRGSAVPGGGVRGAVDPDRGVLYAATSIRTALAEVFQDEAGHLRAETPRIIDLADGTPTLLAWTTQRDLRLLDLTGGWPLRRGASASLPAEERTTCQAWSRAITGAHPELDGLWVPSTLTGETMPVLFAPSQDSFPPKEALNRGLTDPGLRPFLESAAEQIGYLMSDQAGADLSTFTTHGEGS